MLPSKTAGKTSCTGTPRALKMTFEMANRKASEGSRSGSVPRNFGNLVKVEKRATPENGEVVSVVLVVAEVILSEFQRNLCVGYQESFVPVRTL